MSNKAQKKKASPLLGGRGKDLLIVAVLGLVLFYTAWKIFQEDDASKAAAQLQLSQSEIKVMRILQEIDGVGEASVVVCEKEGEIKSVVVICEGANNLRVIMNVREAVATALGADQKAIKIYLKKD